MIGRPDGCHDRAEYAAEGEECWCAILESVGADQCTERDGGIDEFSPVCFDPFEISGDKRFSDQCV